MNNGMKVDTQADLKPQKQLFLWKPACELPEYENESVFFQEARVYFYLESNQGGIVECFRHVTE